MDTKRGRPASARLSGQRLYAPPTSLKGGRAKTTDGVRRHYGLNEAVYIWQKELDVRICASFCSGFNYRLVDELLGRHYSWRPASLAYYGHDEMVKRRQDSASCAAFIEVLRHGTDGYLVTEFSR